jgi:hypothetical protein
VACVRRAEVQVLEQPRRHGEAGEPDDDVHDVARGPRAEDLRDHVRVEETDDEPVEGSDDDQRERDRLEPLQELHRFLLV